MPDLTDEQIRDAFLVGAHERFEHSAASERLVQLHASGDFSRRAPVDRPLSAKWYMIMTMQLRGLTGGEIAKKMNCNPNSISRICGTEKYRTSLEARMRGLDLDIITLKPKAIDALSNALSDPNRDTALRAARTYFEMTGQGTFGRSAQTSADGVSAVSLAKALVSQARAEVHVHVSAAGTEGARFGTVIDATTEGRRSDAVAEDAQPSLPLPEGPPA